MNYKTIKLTTWQLRVAKAAGTINNQEIGGLVAQSGKNCQPHLIINVNVII